MAEDKQDLEEGNDEQSGAGLDPEVGGGKRIGGLIKILMIGASILVGVIIMIVISNIVFNIKSSGQTKQEEVLWAPGVTPKKDAYQTIKVDPIKLNLNDETGANPFFISVEMALAFEKNNIPLQTELNERQFEMRDKIIALISSKTYGDINTPDKVQGMKKEIKSQINTLLINGMIEDIYFIEFNAMPRS
jgi:flagellar FliL protein